MAENLGLTLALIKALGGGGGGGGGAVDDVQVNGVSVVTDGVANIPLASTSNPGAVIVGNGLEINSTNNKLQLNNAGEGTIKSGVDTASVLNPGRQHVSAFYGLAKAAGADMKDISGATVGTYPEAQKSAISTMLNGSVAVSGTTPSITALSGVRYVCGECSTLTITVPASGIIDVVFTSGSTPTVLTISGATVTWANDFDPDEIEANTTYELNVMDGFGVVGQWT